MLNQYHLPEILAHPFLYDLESPYHQPFEFLCQPYDNGLHVVDELLTGWSLTNEQSHQFWTKW